MISNYPSPDTQRLLAELAKPRRFWERWSSSSAIVSLLKQVSQRGEPAAIPTILPFALSNDRATRAEAATAIEQLLVRVQLLDVPLLDNLLRGHFYGSVIAHWGRPLTPVDLNRFTPFGHRSLPLFAIAACDWNGYVRQAAIEWLDRSGDVGALPFLVIRLNDWVPEVRAGAAAALGSWLRPDRAREFATVLPLVARLEGKRRGGHAAFLASVRTLLGREECSDVLLECAASPDRRVRRFAFGAAVEAPDSARIHLLELALTDSDTSIRLWAARIVSSRPPDQHLVLAIELMEHDHFMPVRREALRSHLQQSASVREAALESALFDPHPSIAAEARHYLTESSPRDFALLYRRAVASAEGGALIGALTGLGETGAASDGPLLQSYLSNPSPRVRAAALRAFAKLNPEAPPDILLTALSDVSPRVSRIARRIFPRRGVLTARSQLTEAFERGTERHVRVNALWLLTRLDRWDALPLLLQALRHPDPRVAHAAGHHLERWLADSSRYYVAPSQAQLSAIHDARHEYGHLMRSDWRDLLLFILKPYGEP